MRERTHRTKMEKEHNPTSAASFSKSIHVDHFGL